MRYLFAFLVAFSLTAGAALVWRASTLTAEEKPFADAPAPQDHAGHDDHKDHEDHKDHADHQDHADHEDHQDDKGEDDKAAEVVDLKNTVDPVNGEEIAKGSDITAEYKGFKVHFSSEKNRDRFLKKTIRYLAKLSLELTKDGEALQVDAETYEETGTETCGVMGNEIDEESEVYILHRGFKIRFCCWGGCPEKFLADPAKYYDHYGLEEKDGKLVKKEQK